MDQDAGCLSEPNDGETRRQVGDLVALGTGNVVIVLLES